MKICPSHFFIIHLKYLGKKFCLFTSKIQDFPICFWKQVKKWQKIGTFFWKNLICGFQKIFSKICPSHFFIIYLKYLHQKFFFFSTKTQDFPICFQKYIKITPFWNKKGYKKGKVADSEKKIAKKLPQHISSSKKIFKCWGVF